ncbi:MAG: tRNA pseudouridine(55) synthase TruB [Pirellulales bacterium]|nr:tRNA pseudouridine(55) synthase TruB [Pirellulales bacterium]
MFGILNIHKPSGWTSRDVVNRVQGRVRPVKVGHAGTLDPLATGVLVVAVGPATRLISLVQQMPKEYQATFLLGRTSPSEDTQSKVTCLRSVAQPTLADIEAALPAWIGDVEQRPPIYSALKIHGRRAYQLARQGCEVSLPPRIVSIFSINIVRYAYPELELSIVCGSGTYVRSLGRDLAESLGTGAVMSALNRVAIGRYLDADAVDIEQLQATSIKTQLLSPLTAVSHLPQAMLSAEQAEEIRHGRFIAAAEVNIAGNTSFASTSGPARPVSGAALTPGKNESRGPIIAATNPLGQLVALLGARSPGRLGPLCNFNPC